MDELRSIEREIEAHEREEEEERQDEINMGVDEEVGLCGPCCWGEADTANGNW